MSCSEKLTPLSLDTFYSVGSVCTTAHILKMALSLYLMGRVTVGFGHFLFSLFLELRVTVFVSHVNIYEQAIIFQMHISKMNHWTFLQNKTEKEKQIEISCENELY